MTKDMRKTITKVLIMVSAIVALSSCVKVAPSEKSMIDSGMDQDYDFTYGLREVLQFTPTNPAGSDLFSHYDFFDTFRLKIYVEGGKLSYLEIDNGDLPCEEYPFPLPKGKVACYYDTVLVPHALRLKDTGDIIATFENGQFVFNFVLDCEQLGYRFTFTTLETTRENYEKAY